VLHSPSDVKFDPKGNMYIPDSGIYSGNDSGITYHGDCVIREVSPAGIISTPVGTSGPCGYSGDGGPASAATLNAPQGIAFDATGNLYIADSGNNVIRKVTPSGTISTIVGDGVAGFAGDGGPATGAQLNGPSDVALDSAGSLYIADSYNYRIRKVTPEGVISTVVNEGSGVCPTALAADNNDSIYFADSCASSRVRKLTASGSVTTVAGNGTYGFAGDGGLATAAELADPGGLFVDRNQDLYISDSGNDRIRKVTFPEAKHDPAPRQVLNITAAKVRVVAGAPATLRLDQLLSSYSAPGLTRTQLQAALADVEVGVTIAADGHSYKFHLWSYGSYDGNQRMDTLAAPDRPGTYTITPYITGSGASHFTLNETPGTLTIVAPNRRD
jgi:sugar lactone lactonase YvrE